MNDIVIPLAKAAILAALNQPESFDLEQALKEYPQLQENGAAFVTLNTMPHSQLRGCIGTLEAYRPLYEDIILNAQSAALHDSRFSPLREEELKHIKVEVSILSEPKVLPYKDVEELRTKITPFKDGVVLKHGAHQATYLPQVWEQLPQFDAFFSNLCLKANLDRDCLYEHPEILTYQVEKYQEE
ncbi:MAG: AmmeMemoRadiSam system protein A [Sulfurovum sp.]|nr:MAG: AmmeMemoRadiSam system protein A [Sulfurovum sp.]